MICDKNQSISLKTFDNPTYCIIELKHTPHNTKGYQNCLKDAKVQNVIKVNTCTRDIPLRY